MLSVEDLVQKGFLVWLGAFIQLEVALSTDFARLNRVFVLRQPAAPEFVSTKIATQQ